MRVRTGKLTVAVLAAALTVGSLSAGTASAKTWKTGQLDPIGDGPAPGRDITEVRFQYTSNGSVVFVVTTAGPIDAVGADAAVGASFGATCRRASLSIGGVFSLPDPTYFAKVKGNEIGRTRQGKGVISGNVYRLTIKHAAFKNLKAGCLAVALIDPAAPEGALPTIYDEIGEIRFR